MLELIYTSVRSGLKAGSSGFTFVAWTRGVPPHVLAPLENISGYKPVWMPGSPECSGNPVSFSYRKIRYGALVFRVLSRIGYAGLDYSGRTNKLAHHVLQEEGEFEDSPYGPCGYFLAEGNFYSAWDRGPELLSARCLKPPAAPESCLARTWAARKGDAGWAGAVAAKLAGIIHSREVGDEAVYLEYPPELPPREVLQMVAEVMVLLQPELQMRATFDTYFIQPLLGVETLLRCGLIDNPVLQTMHRLKPQNIISLTGRETLPAELTDDPYVRVARGEVPPEISPDPVPAEASSAPVPSSPDPGPQPWPVVSHRDSRRAANPDGEEKAAAAAPRRGGGWKMSRFVWRRLIPGALLLVVLILIILIIYMIVIRGFLSPSGKSPKQNPAEDAGFQDDEPGEILETEPVFPVPPGKLPEKEVFPAPAQAAERKTPPAASPVLLPSAVQKKKAGPPAAVPARPEKKRWDNKIGRELFINLHEAVKEGSGRLYTFDDDIRSISVSVPGKKLAGKEIDYLSGKDRLFKFKAEKKNLWVRDVWDNGMNAETRAALRKIRSIEITLSSGETVSVDFHRVIHSLDKELQREFSVEDDFRITARDPELLQKNNWLDEYLDKPKFELNSFTDLCSLMEIRNRAKVKLETKRNKTRRNTEKSLEKYKKKADKSSFSDDEISEIEKALAGSYPEFSSKEDFQKEYKSFCEKARWKGSPGFVENAKARWEKNMKSEEELKNQYITAENNFLEKYRKLDLEPICSFEDFDRKALYGQKNVLKKAAEERGLYRVKVGD